MRVWREGDVFVGTHIPGPSHNMLKLRLERGRDRADFTVTAHEGQPVVARKGRLSPMPLVPDEVKTWIQEGIDRANHQLGTDYGVVHAEFVLDDSRRPDVYAAFAEGMVILAHEGAKDGG